MKTYLDIFGSLSSEKGLSPEQWAAIVSMVGPTDPAITPVTIVGGRYFLKDEQRKRLAKILPISTIFDMRATLLPVQSSLDEIKCDCCNGPYHPATGHAFIVDGEVKGHGCGTCSGKFFARLLKEEGWSPLTPKQIKKLNKKERKKARQERIKARKEARKAARLARQVVKEAKQVINQNNPDLQTIKAWPDGEQDECQRVC